MRKGIVASIILVCITGALAAQETEGLKQSNLRFYLSEDRASFAGFVFVNQIWSKYSWNNPGTTDMKGNPMERNFDIGIRRSRLVFYTQLYNRFFIYTQVGYDGLRYSDSKPPALSLFNAVTEYYAVKDKLEIGFGLHTWNGISRYTNSKLMEFLVVDCPGFIYPTAGTYDNAGRQLGLYAKGTLSRLHYRVSVNKPFLFDETALLEPGRSVSVYSERPSVKGYFDWQFMDIESHQFPYMSMNNLGSKKILNVGAGFYYQPGGTQRISMDTGDTLLNDILLLGADAFLDIPVSSGKVFTSYLAVYSYDFGPGYLRSMGKMSTGTGGSLLQGPGINEFETGTGLIARLEAGLMFSQKSKGVAYQPFAGLTYKDLKALNRPSLQYDLGANMFISGHNLKLTAQYSVRPLYEGDFISSVFTLTGYRGFAVLQTQVCF